MAMTTIPMTITSSLSSSRISSSSLAMTKRRKKYSVEWIDLLSSESYPSSSSSSSSEEELKSPTLLLGKIELPRSGGVTFNNNVGDRLFAFGGYAEEAIIADKDDASSSIIDRHAVNDMWHFLPYTNNVSSWGWTLRHDDNNNIKGYVPPSRLATAIAVVPNNNDCGTRGSPQAVLLGGWDPQTPGTGGIILDDVTMLDIDTLVWSRCIDAMDSESYASLPDGPTSRHVAVHLSISKQRDDDKHDGAREDIICLHNHRCDDHILQLSMTTAKEGTRVRWDRQATTGEAPSSRGLHCATTIHQSTAMVLFGGAAKDGNMSNEAFVLDTETWKWTKLDCIGDDNTALPAPRAGACLCSLDENSVLLFGGATPGEKGLVGLNDVWVLHVNKDSGRGTWDCLIEHQNDDDDDGGIKIDDGILRPPGRNAASLNEIDRERLLPKDIIWKRSGSSLVDKCKYFLLNGGWYPFRKTYNYIFLLRILTDE